MKVFHQEGQEIRPRICFLIIIDKKRERKKRKKEKKKKKEKERKKERKKTHL